MHKKLSLMVSSIVLSASMVFGSGFSIYEQGAKASALGGAFIAQANDVSAVFYNPAGITSLEGTKLGLGTTIIMPTFGFQGPTNIDPNLYTEAEKGVFPPSTLYATYQIDDKLTAGFGFFTAFGLGSEWDKDWVGKQLATKSEIQTFFLNPVVAYQVMDGLSVAAGFSFVYGTVLLERAIYFGPRDLLGDSKLEASTTGWGYNVALQYKPMPELTLGLIHRGNVLLEFEDGDATFDFPATGNPVIAAELAAIFPDTKGSADLELPTSLGFGVAYQFTDKLVAEFDWLQLGWSSYDKLTVKFDEAVGGSTETTSEREYEDSYSLRFGVEYLIESNMAIRLGYIRDNHAAPDNRLEPSLPEGDRNLYSIGFGYTIDNITIDGFYMLLSQEDRKITNSVEAMNGIYTGIGNLFGVSVEFGL